MSAKFKQRKASNKVYIICATVAVLALAVIFGLFLSRNRQVAPVYELEVEGLEAETPAEAQAACRGDHERFAEAMEKYGENSWVWCGGKTLYLVESDVLIYHRPLYRAQGVRAAGDQRVGGVYL